MRDLWRIPERDGHWLAGLVDGEGCFFLSTTRTRRVRGGDRLYRCLIFEFKLALRADDMTTVRLAQELLEVGSLRVFQRGRSTSPNAKPLVTLVVYGREDIPRVIEFFRRFPLRSKKASDFRLWAEAFEHFENVRRATALNSVRKGTLGRKSKGKRRPIAGTERQRFRTIPDELWAEMDHYARLIVATREYREESAA